VAAVIKAVGEANFFERILQLLETACDFQSGGAMILHRHRSPVQLVHRVNLVDRRLSPDIYLSWPYVLDPHYQLFLDGCPSGCYWVQDIAPDDFRESEYFKGFYSRIGISDSIDILWRVDNDTALTFFIERGLAHPCFDATDLVKLDALLPILDAACRRHQEFFQWTDPVHPRDSTHLKLESALENFGKSVLTRREREVLVLTLRGYSAALAGEKLGASEGTIKIHRKSIYRKLDVSSQAELFALFVRCIPFANLTTNADPLAAYESRPAGELSLPAVALPLEF
jgi:DNA-binding CsgD family transcriptional regulator